MRNPIGIRLLRNVICLILIGYYALPVVYPVFRTELQALRTDALAGMSAATAPATEEKDPLSHIILKKQRLILRSIDSDSFPKYLPSAAYSADARRSGLIFLFENRLPHSVKIQAGYLGLFAGISPPIV